VRRRSTIAQAIAVYRPATETAVETAL